MLERFRDLLATAGAASEVCLPGTPTRLSGSVRVVCGKDPVRLQLGEHVLGLYRERRLGPDGGETDDWILCDAVRYGLEITGFARIRKNESLIVGHTHPAISRMFSFGPQVKGRHVKITNSGTDIVLSQLDRDAETWFCAFDANDGLEQPAQVRLRNLARVRGLFGGPIGLLPNDTALATLQQVNALLSWEGFRRKDRQGQPGGLLVLPADQTPIIVGDLHARVDNLLRILCEDGYLRALERGTAYLLFLGDTIHPDQDGELEDMDSSIVILDLICRLMVRFPDNVFYLRGNHESFDADVTKGGVPQGLLLHKRLRELRGEQYAREVARFFDLLPYVAVSKDFATCHGGPVQCGIRRSDIVDIRGHQDLARVLTRIRPRRTGGYTGFTKRDIESFRRNLELPSDAAIIVAHTPLASDEACWTDANGIPNHHIVYSAHQNSIGLYVRVGGTLTPVEIPAETLTDLANALPERPEEAHRRPCVA